MAPADFGELAKLYRPMLERSALRLCGNLETAKDLVQETLLRGVQRFNQLKPGTNTAAWLVTILTNLYFDQLRRVKVEQRAILELERRIDESSGSPVVTAPDSVLYAAIAALEPDLRKVVELCGLQGMRYREAALILGVPVGTVGTRLQRARTQLLALLTTMTQDDGTP